MKKAIPHQQSSFVRQNFFLMIFLSLQLMLLSFFIFFVSHSSFEKNKIKAVQTSLRSSFNVPSSSLSFEANAIELYYQTQLKKIFPNSKIEHHLNNDTIKITFDIQTLFKQNSDNFSLYASVFLKQIKQLVDESKYFTINRARQYGKTTTLRALYRYLKSEYYVVLMDFQTFGSLDFESEHTFAIAFANSFVRLFLRNDPALDNPVNPLSKLTTDSQNENFSLRILFNDLNDICSVSDKPIVLMIDEVDSAANNQVFLDFLSQLRAGYIDRDLEPTFKSVILAGVYDIKNLKHKLRNDDEHKYNSPWNIAADFNIDMSFSQKDIYGMLSDYEDDYHTGMDIEHISGLIYSYTSGYPYLVSRICQIMDEKLPEKYTSKHDIWTVYGFNSAIRILLSEKNTLFESLSEKLNSYPVLSDMLKNLLFTGKSISYNYYEESINIATMFGFVRDNNGVLVISNRIFETWLHDNFPLPVSCTRWLHLPEIPDNQIPWENPIPQNSEKSPRKA